MQYIVCYDIADDARRSRLASALLDFGPRAQESVFIAHLDDQLYQRMMKRIEAVIRADQDRVHVFALCAACGARTKVFGTAEIVQDKEFYIL